MPTTQKPSRYRVIDLKGQVPSKGSIDWLNVALPRQGSQLAIVNFAVGGSPQPYGLRLDLGKGVFLDQPEDPDLVDVAKRSAGVIVDTVLRRASAKRTLRGFRSKRRGTLGRAAKGQKQAPKKQLVLEK